MPEFDMSEYWLAASDAYCDGLLPLFLAKKLGRTRTPKMFYQCLAANGYLSDVWDMVLDENPKYPWRSDD